jgi:hypothetical protein
LVAFFYAKPLFLVGISFLPYSLFIYTYFYGTASCAMGTGSFPEVKWPGHENDHTPPSSTEVMKRESYNSMQSLGQFRPVKDCFIFLLLCESNKGIKIGQEVY